MVLLMVLKVLDSSEAPLEDIPKEVFKLFLLKCLSIRRTKVGIIPKSIGKLQNLEFLDLFHTNVTKMPVEILKLRKLHVLYVGQIEISAEYYGLRGGFKFSDGIGKLGFLENLQAIDADNEKILREIGKLTKLRQLSITKLRREDGKEFLCSLEKLSNLKVLVVHSIQDDMTLDLQHSISPPPFLEILSLQGKMGNIPQWMLSLQSLRKLVLDDSELREDDGTDGIGSLQYLPNLRELTLQHAYEGEMLFFRDGGFQKLEKLSITSSERLKWVRAEDGSLPSLQRLSMRGCKLVEELPLSTENLRKLESLFLVDMSDGLVEKVMTLDEQSEEYRALKNIPRVRVQYRRNGRRRTYTP